MGEEPKINLDLKIETKADLTEIAGQLLEKVDKGAGAWFAPTMTKREAKAAAAVKVIEAKTEAKIAKINQEAWLASAEFQEKALQVMQQRAVREYGNITAVASQACRQLTEGAKPDEIDDDWMANLIDKAKLVSNEQMQTVWSHVLAGEANAPGSFSRRTVNFLADLDQSDCELFTKLCCFHCSLGRDPTDAVPLILDLTSPPYRANGIHFEMLAHLESIGLVTTEFGGGYNHEGASWPFAYFDTHLTVTLPEGVHDKSLPIGIVLYTKVGRELVQIAGGKPHPDFLSFIRERWHHLLSESTAQTDGH